MGARVPTLRVPGKLYLALHERAMIAAERGDNYEMDLADAVSRATVKRKGGGYQAFIPLTPDEIDRLAMWVRGRNREAFYQAADNLRAQMEAEASLGG